MTKVTAKVEIKGFYNIEETAKLLGKGVATIWRMVKAGKILVVRVGGRTLIPESEIERLKTAK